MRKSRVLAAVLIGSGVVLLLPGSAFACHEPRLEQLPPKLSPGDRVPFSISGTEAGANFTVTLEGHTVASGKAEGSSVDGEFTVPDLGSSRTVYLSALVDHSEGHGSDAQSEWRTPSVSSYHEAPPAEAPPADDDAKRGNEQKPETKDTPRQDRGNEKETDVASTPRSSKPKSPSQPLRGTNGLTNTPAQPAMEAAESGVGVAEVRNVAAGEQSGRAGRGASATNALSYAAGHRLGIDADRAVLGDATLERDISLPGADTSSRSSETLVVLGIIAAFMVATHRLRRRGTPGASGPVLRLIAGSTEATEESTAAAERSRAA